MVLQKHLKESTARLHAELEKLMLVDKIKDGSLTFADYQRMLLTNYALHRKYECFLLEGLSPETATQLEMDKLRKLPSLEKDLVQAGMTPPAKNDNFEQTIQLENNDAARLGAMYVFEGATLGGNVIVKLLRLNPQMQTHQLNYFYYSQYADNLVTYWKNFCAVLNQQQISAWPSILSAAQIIFEDFIKSAKTTKDNLAE